MTSAPAARAAHLAATRKISFVSTPGPQAREFFLYRPGTEIAGAPMVVSIHGIARNAAAHAFRLIEAAERYGVAVVAPLFAKESYGQYQQINDIALDARSDHALIDIVEAAARLTQGDPRRLLLFGFSGGAQFAHRFAMTHPERVASAALAAAGWYTMPKLSRPYPQGLGPSAHGINFTPREFLRVRYHVMVGALDTLRDASFRKSKKLDRTQGRNRVERALSWVRAMNAFAARGQIDAPATFLLLPGVGHSFVEAVEHADLVSHVFDRFASDANLKPAEGAG